MSKRKVSISMPEELHERMKKFDGKAVPKRTTAIMSVSMPKALNDRMRNYDNNWSKVARIALEQEVRIREAIATGDRTLALQAKAQADCSDVEHAGLLDALTYPIDEIHYKDLSILEDHTREFDSNSKQEIWVAAFDQLNKTFESSTPKYRLKFANSSNYRFGFMQGLLTQKRIADGQEGHPT
jgi:post-segregation antitoxin (ccd killing protein)